MRSTSAAPRSAELTPIVRVREEKICAPTAVRPMNAALKPATAAPNSSAPATGAPPTTLPTAIPRPTTHTAATSTAVRHASMRAERSGPASTTSERPSSSSPRSRREVVVITQTPAMSDIIQPASQATSAPVSTLYGTPCMMRSAGKSPNAASGAS